MDREVLLRSAAREGGIRLYDCRGSAALREPEFEGCRWGSVLWGSGLAGADLTGAWRCGAGLAGEVCVGFWREGVLRGGVVAPLDGAVT